MRNHDPAAQAGRQTDAGRWPVIETERLILRPWRSDDIAVNTAMLSDPAPRASLRPTQADHE